MSLQCNATQLPTHYSPVNTALRNSHRKGNGQSSAPSGVATWHGIINTLAPMPLRKICVGCGLEFLDGRMNNRKYCSQSCYDVLHTTPRNKPCRRCGNTIHGQGTKFCSRKCAKEPRRCRVPGRTCRQCDALITTGGWVFCTKACGRLFNLAKLSRTWKESNPRKPVREVACGHCGGVFMQKVFTHLYCTKACMFDHQKSVRLARYVTSKQPKICLVCAKNFDGGLNGKFCSQKCQNKGPASRASKRRQRLKNSALLCVRQRLRYKTDPAYRSKLLSRIKAYAKSNPIMRIRQRLRKRVRNLMTLKASGISALVGCNSPTLRAWLESKFTKSMNWDNYGKHWVVDHRIPLAAFDLNSLKQRMLACHYTNLQPLTHEKNAEKADSITDPQIHLLM